MIIVTGGAGFIGSALIWELNRKGYDDILVVDNFAKTEKWKNLVPLKYSDYIHKDVFIKKVREKGLSNQVKAIIHLGACSSTMETDADYLMENNFRYTKDLFLAANARKVRFINASSAATYGDGEFGFAASYGDIAKLRPLNMYGYSKQLFDLWSIRTKAVHQLVSLKFFNVYGPNEYHKDGMRSVVCKAVSQIEETGKLSLFKSYKPEYKNGEQMRDFVYIKDVTRLILWLLETPDVNGIYNVGQGKARSWNDLANAVFSAMGRKTNIEYVDMPSQLIEKYQYYTEADMQWLEQAKYPYSFASLEDGVKDYVQNYLLKENALLEIVDPLFVESKCTHI